MVVIKSRPSSSLLQFHGNGGLSKCEGTTEVQAIKNADIRDEVARDHSLEKWLKVFILEQNVGRVTIDELKACNHVRHVLNEMRSTHSMFLRYVDSIHSCYVCTALFKQCIIILCDVDK